jgi:hypothetical protein
MRTYSKLDFIKCYDFTSYIGFYFYDINGGGCFIMD